MAEPSPSTLNYGHFGHAAFDSENGAWNFSRNIEQRSGLVQLGTWRTVLAPAAKLDQTGTPEHAQNMRNAQSSARLLGRSNPELVPCLELVPELAVTSAAVTSITNVYDPAIGSLLSFGSFTFKDHHENPRRVAALPAGECGNILRLVALKKEKHGWGTAKGPDKSIWIQGPSIVDEESRYWTEDAAPIQQVCFAQGDMRSAFLAVRFPMRTVLFRPIYRMDRTPPTRSKYYELPYSKIDAQPILDIHIEQTGGVPHADVTFNPEYQRQVGLVDQKGNWSVWDIEGGKREGKGYTLLCASQGNINLEEPEQMQEQEDQDLVSRDDGWARIQWIADVNTILVCTRRTIGIFDIRSKPSSSLKCAELIPKRSADWILDVKTHPKNKRRFFLLTSSRLYLLAVTCLNDVSDDDGDIAGATVLIAWTHFQGLEDFTLQLCVPTTSDEDSMVLMYSRLKPLIMVFRFQDSESESSLPFSSSDPTVLRLDNEILDSSKGSQHITHLHVEQLHYEEAYKHCDTDAGHMYSKADVRFYRLSAMLSDLGVHQVILYSHEPDIETSEQTRLIVKPPNWATIVHPRKHIIMESLVDVDDNDFIIQDEIEANALPRVKRPYSTPRMVQVIKKTPLVDFGFVHNALTGGEVTPANSESLTVKSEDASTIIDRVKNLLVEDADAGGVKEWPRKTLMEFAKHKINVSDIDKISSQLFNLFTLESYSRPFELRRIASAQALHLPYVNGQELTISTLYDTILQNWIAPLPVNIPVRVRQSKEKLARQITAEIMLASSRIRSSELWDRVTASQVGTGYDSSVRIPSLSTIREESGLDDNTITFSQPSLPSSQPQPQPASSSSFPTTSQSNSQPSNPIARLSQHLNISRPLPNTPAGVAKVLAHWTPATDPSTYDWEAMSRLLDQEEDEESQQQREKVRRKQERLRKRQRREEAIAQGRVRVESQPLPFIVDTERRGIDRQQVHPTSSPGPMFASDVGGGQGGIGMAGSSQSLGMPFAQSQVEPGRHGGRPVKKKKLRVRVSGF